MRTRSIAVVLALTCAACIPTDPGTTTTESTTTTPPSVVAMHGMTVEDVDTGPLIASLAAFDHRPTVRVVFQPGVGPDYYRPALTAIQPYADVVGLVYDSTALAAASLTQVKARIAAFLTLGPLVDIWEVGNEVNGEWCDEGYPSTPRPAATTAKIDAVFDAVKAVGARTALTGIYMPGCTEWPSAEMFGWLTANVSIRVKSGVDHAWVSYYEDNCTGAVYPLTHWQALFDRLATLFPNANVGFGEVGYADDRKAGPNNPRMSNAAKTALMDRYYSLDIDGRFESGGFWWYAYQDVVPHTGNPLWTALNDAFGRQR
jgi:hypothetical protein